MEGDTVSEGEDKMRPPKPGEEDSTVLETALTIAEGANSPASEKPFPFLQLPPEVRNVVYQKSCIYETPGSEMISGLLTFPDLRQPPITRVNKQLRNETLPVFYGNHKFSIRVPRRAESYENFNNGNDNFKHVWEMLRSFANVSAPEAKSTMQTSSLRFLTLFACQVDPDLASDDPWALLGFTMSSNKLTREKGHSVLQTKNLDWERFSMVKEAYYEGIKRGIYSHGEELNRISQDLLQSFYAHSRIDELVSLMCFLAWNCPHLKSNVLVTVEEYVEQSEASSSEMSE